MTTVKICGLSTFEDSKIAIDEGVDLIGFVFVAKVRRMLNERTAKQIIHQVKRIPQTNSSTKIVGLFANQSISKINRVVKECQLDFVQLCGVEPLSFWKAVDTNVIKQLRIPPSPIENLNLDSILRTAESIYSSGSKILIDSEVSGRLGGTGVKPNWNIASKISSEYPIILAGGLNPSNVSDAIEAVSPWGVDVSSGVESRNHKDPRKIVDFIRNSKRTNK